MSFVKWDTWLSVLSIFPKKLSFFFLRKFTRLSSLWNSRPKEVLPALDSSKSFREVSVKTTNDRTESIIGRWRGGPAIERRKISRIYVSSSHTARKGTRPAVRSRSALTSGITLRDAQIIRPARTRAIKKLSETLFATRTRRRRRRRGLFAFPRAERLNYARRARRGRLNGAHTDAHFRETGSFAESTANLERRAL